MVGLKDQCFGVEVEMTGITREQAARALANYFGTEPHYKGGAYGTWSVEDPRRQTWKLVSDSSILAEWKTSSGYEVIPDDDEGRDYWVEMVTPKLTYDELPVLQECVRRVRQAGAKVNSSCGIHVHVDAANHNRQSLKNLIGIMFSNGILKGYRQNGLPATELKKAWDHAVREVHQETERINAAARIKPKKWRNGHGR